jgi:hypothetical protein
MGSKMGLWGYEHTFPTAASPKRTNFTLLLGLGAGLAPASAIESLDVGS